jgi:hypothetical protein
MILPICLGFEVICCFYRLKIWRGHIDVGSSPTSGIQLSEKSWPVLKLFLWFDLFSPQFARYLMKAIINFCFPRSTNQIFDRF